jgi:hypothetical protein
LKPALYHEIEQRLPGTLAKFVEQHYAGSSWTALAAKLEAITGIGVSDETLRRWFADRIEVKTKVTVR